MFAGSWETLRHLSVQCRLQTAVEPFLKPFEAVFYDARPRPLLDQHQQASVPLIVKRDEIYGDCHAAILFDKAGMTSVFASP
jgi:hypothetical protein